jgi:ribosomal protein S19E (S16A)
MDVELDYDLAPDQWDALKALRLPACERRAINRLALAQLMTLGLVVFRDELPAITPRGRKVLIRGSSKLMDLVA